MIYFGSILLLYLQLYSFLNVTINFLLLFFIEFLSLGIDLPVLYDFYASTLLYKWIGDSYSCFNVLVCFIYNNMYLFWVSFN